jgi:hypothetical protein
MSGLAAAAFAAFWKKLHQKLPIKKVKPTRVCPETFNGAKADIR